MRFALKDYQVDAVGDVLRNLADASDDWHRRERPVAFSLTATTGAGTTVMAAAVIEALFEGSPRELWVNPELLRRYEGPTPTRPVGRYRTQPRNPQVCSAFPLPAVVPPMTAGREVRAPARDLRKFRRLAFDRVPARMQALCRRPRHHVTHNSTGAPV